jgi:hypothetical protein
VIPKETRRRPGRKFTSCLNRSHGPFPKSAREYNIDLKTWTPSAITTREASAIAKRARSLDAALGSMSVGLRMGLQRYSGLNPEMSRAATLDSYLLPVRESVLEGRNESIASWRSRLSALAKLSDMVAYSTKRRTRKIPFLNTELAFDCLCFLAACGKTPVLKRGGDVAKLAAAVLEWATGKETDANYFDGRMDKLKLRRHKWREDFGAGEWDREIRGHAEAIIRGDWP